VFKRPGFMLLGARDGGHGKVWSVHGGPSEYISTTKHDGMYGHMQTRGMDQ